MPDRQDSTSGNPSAPLIEERGDIQRGKTRDKIPGFDPAAAPLETDSEAGGAPLQATRYAHASAEAGENSPNASSYADAMRDPCPNRRGGRFWVIVVAAAIILVAVALLMSVA